MDIAIRSIAAYCGLRQTEATSVEVPWEFMGNSIGVVQTAHGHRHPFDCSVLRPSPDGGNQC
ncbi:hypothetical protein CP993_25920, partial [Escherichia coli]